MWGICEYIMWLYVKVFSVKFGVWRSLARQKRAICEIAQFTKFFSLESLPLYGNHLLSYSIYALSTAEGTAGPPGALTAQGPFMLRWVNDTPSVNGNTVQINLAIGPSYKSVMCRLIPRPFQNCKVTSNEYIFLYTVHCW